MIAEDLQWRAQFGPGRKHWSSDAKWHPIHSSAEPAPWLQGRDGEEVLRPEQIAVLYRALRKAREDDKDHAGAGDM